jgi:hypothetical protein
VDMSGLAKIMMVTFRATLSLKVLLLLFRLWLSWLDDFSFAGSWWISRSRSSSWNSDQTLQAMATRKVNFN